MGLPGALEDIFFWLYVTIGHNMNQSQILRSKTMLAETHTNSLAGNRHASQFKSLSEWPFPPELLRWLKRRAKGRIGSLLRGQLSGPANSAFKTTQAGQQFDTVFSVLSFSHFADPVEALNELARLCPQGGRIVVVERASDAFEIETAQLSGDRFLFAKRDALEQGTISNTATRRTEGVLCLTQLYRPVSRSRIRADR